LLLHIWKPLAIGSMLGMLVGMAVYLFLGPVFSASTQILVSRPPEVPDRNGRPNSYGDRGDHLKLIKTDEIIVRAFRDHGLQEIPSLAESYDPLKNVSEDLSVARTSGQESSFDNILEITYSHPDKSIAKRVVQAVVEAYRDYLVQTRKEKSNEVYTLLLRQHSDYDEKIREAEAEYHQFRKNAPVYLKASPVIAVNGMPAPVQSQAEMEAAELEKAQRENLRRRSGIEARLATLHNMREEQKPREVMEFWVMQSLSVGTSSSGSGNSGGSTAGLAGPPAKGQLDQQLLTARLLEQRLLQSLGPDHVSVKNVQQQIDTILDFYRRQGLTPPTLERSSSPSNRPGTAGVDMVTVYEQMLQEQLHELDADNEKLVLLHADAQQRAKDAQLFEIEDQRRKDDIARLKKQADQNFAQIAAYDVAQEQEGYRMKQISQVRVQRSLKQVLKIVGACTLAGMAIVFCLAYFREWSDTRLKTLAEVRDFTRSPLLGAVPSFSTNSLSEKTRESRWHPALRYFHQPASREAEAFRSIRTALLFTLKSGQQVVQVSSAEPGDGKSTTLANLAIAFAQSGKRVLLLDADLRRPTQHTLFALAQEQGLSEVLQQQLKWRDAVQTTPVEGLSVITAGTTHDRPAELLAAANLQGLMQELRAQYDIILVDTPPVLAVSDPCVISTSTDGLLLVVRMLKNRQLSLQRAMELLHSQSVRVFGVVANAVDQEQAREAGLSADTYAGYYDDDASSGAPRRSSSRRPVAPATAAH
jgi:capsular exopolysaccharide synthesis family protein